MKIRKDRDSKLISFHKKVDSRHRLWSIPTISETGLQHFIRMFEPYIDYIETGVRQSCSIIMIKKNSKKFDFVAPDILKFNLLLKMCSTQRTKMFKIFFVNKIVLFCNKYGNFIFKTLELSFLTVIVFSSQVYCVNLKFLYFLLYFSKVLLALDVIFTNMSLKHHPTKHIGLNR